MAPGYSYRVAIRSPATVATKWAMGIILSQMNTA